MAKFVAADIAGQKFGRWTAISNTGEKTKNGTSIWLCRCDCGNYGKISISNLRYGSSKSCGCIPRERMAKLNYKHGGKKERLYAVWGTMRRRCQDENHKDFANYGGRGIEVCQEWQDYEEFRKWAFANGYDPNAPKQKCTIDRIDVNGNYEPDNCRWVSAKVQQNNRRNNRVLTYDNETNTLAEWNRKCGFPKDLIAKRLNAGWTLERAITTPAK